VVLVLRPISDTALAVDAAAGALALLRSLTDQAPATDFVAVETHRRFLTDSAAAVESVGMHVVFVRSITDSAPATDVAVASTSKSFLWPPAITGFSLAGVPSVASAALG
jgi:hypothetical protein